MKEPDGKGLAIHTDSESCADVRKGGGEALTGVRVGRVLSREKFFHSGVPTPCSQAEGHIESLATAREIRTLRGQRPRARADASRSGTGRSRTCLGAHQGRIEQSQDERR